MHSNVDTQPKTTGATPTGKSPVARLWGFFSSMKTAIALLLILAAASVVGTVIEQGLPAEMYIGRYGQHTYRVLKAVMLTDVYHSPWYNLLLALIGLNLTVCSVNRFRIAWRRTFSPNPVVKAPQIESMQRSERYTTTVDAHDAAHRVCSSLRSAAYHCTVDRGADAVSIHAVRGRMNTWGPYLTHLSILIIFAGAIIGHRLGFEGRTLIQEGESMRNYYVPGDGGMRTLDFDLRLRSFKVEHDAEHNPTAYKSDLDVLDGGVPAAHKVIDVNHPLTYKGVSFFQESYGIAGLKVKVTGRSGRPRTLNYEIRQDTDGSYTIPENAPRLVAVDGKTFAIFVHSFEPDFVEEMNGSASPMPIHPAVQVYANDKWPGDKAMKWWSVLGWLPVGKSVDYNGCTITLDRAVSYTVLGVSMNPGLPVVYVGFALMLLGVFISFYVTRKTIRIRVTDSSTGTVVLVGASTRAPESGFDRIFDRIREAL